MVELVATITLFLGLIGMGTILYRKIPILAELPEIPGGLNLKAKILRLKEKIKNLKYFESISFDILLQKILSKIRILSLKAEKKTSLWLQKLREKSAKKKENDKYWEELKESIEEEKSENNNLPA